MNTWVFLADPEDYGWNELVDAGDAVWDGVKNAIAQRNMRACKKGDIAFIYHTAPDKAIVGIAKVTGEHRADPNNEERVVLDVTAVKPLKRPLPLAELKNDAVLSGMSFVKMPRVAVQPINAEQRARILELSGTRL